MRRFLLAVLLILLAVETLGRVFLAGKGGLVERARDPELVYELRPGDREHEGAFLKIPAYAVRVNEHRCRDDPFTSEDLADGTLRVLFLGDSFTFAEGVPEEKSFPALIETRLAAAFPERRVRAMNCGVLGYNFTQLVRDAESRLRELRPALLVVDIFANDLQGAMRPDWMLPESPFARWLVENSRAARLLALAASSAFVKDPTAAEVEEGLDRIHGAAYAAGVPVVFAVIADPSRGDIHFKEMLRDKGLVALAAPRRLLETPELLVPRNGHWNARGHRAFAAWLAPELLRALRE